MHHISLNKNINCFIVVVTKDVEMGEKVCKVKHFNFSPYTLPTKKHDVWLEGSCFLARCHAFMLL